MPFNLSGALVAFQLVFKPRIIVPNLRVKDIRQLDFTALKKAGYRGAVFDKDNCLTLPYKDDLVPDLQDAWSKCRETFGRGNILIVSNSAGTTQDAGGIQAEAISGSLQVPVLFHKSPKPSYSCIAGIKKYFASLDAPVAMDELIIVGDRLFTDVVLSNRMHIATTNASRPAPLSVWTTAVWHRESMFLRWCESGLLKMVERWSSPKTSWSNFSMEHFVVEKSPPAASRSRLLQSLYIQK